MMWSDGAETESSAISAAALHDVVSQAMKNLRFLTLGNEDLPDTNYWANTWGINRKKNPYRDAPAPRDATSYWREALGRGQQSDPVPRCVA